MSMESAEATFFLNQSSGTKTDGADPADLVRDQLANMGERLEAEEPEVSPQEPDCRELRGEGGVELISIRWMGTRLLGDDHVPVAAGCRCRQL